MDIGPGELIVILVVVLVLFGGSQLPKLARSIGEAQREFRGGAIEARDAGGEPEPARGGDGPPDPPPV